MALTHRELVIAVLSMSVLAVAVPVATGHGGGGGAAVASSTASSEPDTAAAQRQAKAQGSRVEIADRRTETTTTFANPDGTLSLQESAGPIWAPGPDGSYVRVDDTLRSSSSGLRPAAADIDATFSSDGSGDAATINAAGGTVGGGGAAPVSGGPTVQRNEAVYPLSDGTQMHLYALPASVEQTIVLLSRPAAPPTYRIPLDLHGMSAKQEADGTISLYSGAGGAALTVPLARMWGSDDDPGTDQPAHTAQVDMKLVGDSILLRPSASFLDDPAVQYPVTIDPTYSTEIIGRLGDVAISDHSPYTTGDTSAVHFMIGLSGGGNIYRAFENFVTPSLPAGTKFVSADLALYQYNAPTCSARTMKVYPITSSWGGGTLEWGNQPTVGSATTSQSFNYGDETAGCSNSWAHIDISSIESAYLNGTLANHGLELRGSSESDTSYSKSFCSQNAAYTDCGGVPSYVNPHPTVTITYNSYPYAPTNPSMDEAPGCVTGASSPYVNTVTPTLTMTVSDPDGGNVQGDIRINHQAGADLGPYQLTNSVPSGSTASWTVPAGWLTDGGHYSWNARSYDGALYSDGYSGTYYGWSAWCEFYVDTTPPSAPAVTASSVSDGTWADTHPASNTFTFTDASGDTTSYLYSEDGGAWTAVGGNTAQLAWDPASGYHTLDVKAQDHASNTSTATRFTFGDGHPALSVLQPQMMTARYLPVSASGPGGAIGGYLQWKPTTASTWTQLDGSTVTADGNGWDGAVTTSSDGTASLTPTLIWDSSNVPTAPLSVDVQACFSYPTFGDKYSTPVTVQRVAHAFGGDFATAPAGPGQVALSTGELQVTTTDATLPGYASDLSVSRSYLSYNGSSGTHAGFGPGWSTTLPTPDSGMLDATVVDHLTGANPDGTIDLVTPDGETGVYTDPNWTGADTALGQADVTLGYTDENGANTDGSTLTVSTDEKTLTLTDNDGTRTQWTRSDTSADWTATEVIEPGDQGTETVTSGTYAASDTMPPGAVAGDSWTMTVTHAPGVDCSNGLVAGCRALTVIYANPLTPTPLDANPGPYPGQVRELAYTGYDNDRTDAAGLPDPGMSTVVAGVYAYDSNGRLVSAYDPRADVTTGQHLTTSYGYDSAGRLTSITPPGQQAWTFTYNTTSGDPHDGWLTEVTRHDPNFNGGSDDTTHYIYGVALSGDGLPDLTSGAISSWAQPATDAPTTAVAIFRPDHTVGDGPSSSDWPYATISYLDATGRATNTANYGENGDGTSGWQIDTTVYDTRGRIASTLTAANRGLALSASSSNCPAAVPPLVCSQPSAVRAQLLSSINVYADQHPDSSDGTDPALLTDTYEPATLVTPDGATAQITARAHTHTDYDQNAPTPPSTGPDKWRLPTTITTSAYQLDNLTDPTQLDVASADVDPRITTDGYDPLDSSKPRTDPTSGWVLGKPTTVTTDPGTGHLAITTRTVYDSNGNPTRNEQPKSDGSDAGTTKTVYYTAGANTDDAQCGNHPEWDGLTCTTGPAAQPPGQTMPTSRVTDYSLLLEPETVQDTSSATTRTTTMSYDGVGRMRTRSVSEDPATGDQPVPTQTYGYDPSTGLPTTISTDQGTQTAGYDTLGRVISQTDGSGANTATTSYDADSRPATVTDAKGSYTYTYDGTGEHRGLVTDVDTGIGAGINSHISVGYDATGSPVSETYPNGVKATDTYDPAGELTELAYRDYAGATIADWTLTYNSGGQIASEQGPSAVGTRTEVYSYDNAARLTQVNDTRGDACTTRGYTLDADSNRTGQSSWVGAAGGSCPDTSTAATTSRTASYDSADRITDASTTNASTVTSGNYSYDTLGRVGTLPAVDATAGSGSGSGDIALKYYVNDLVYSETQGGTTRTFGLDPAYRLARWTDSAASGNATTTNHYDDTSDSPDWTDNGDGTWNRDIAGPDGNLAIVVNGNNSGTQSADVQILNPHGDVATTIPDTPDAVASQAGTLHDTDEYGVPLTSALPRYDWLGGKQRSTDGATGLVQMGFRLYNPATGRFLQTDPMPGGSANAYDYCNQDPINNFDLSGTIDEPAIDGIPMGSASDAEVGEPVQASRAEEPTEGQLNWATNIREQAGRRALEKARTKTIRRLREHEVKLQLYRTAGGHTSSVEREIRNSEASFKRFANFWRTSCVAGRTA